MRRKPQRLRPRRKKHRPLPKSNRCRRLMPKRPDWFPCWISPPMPRPPRPCCPPANCAKTHTTRWKCRPHKPSTRCANWQHSGRASGTTTSSGACSPAANWRTSSLMTTCAASPPTRPSSKKPSPAMPMTPRCAPGLMRTPAAARATPSTALPLTTSAKPATCSCRCTKKPAAPTAWSRSKSRPTSRTTAAKPLPKRWNSTAASVAKTS